MDFIISISIFIFIFLCGVFLFFSFQKKIFQGFWKKRRRFFLKDLPNSNYLTLSFPGNDHWVCDWKSKDFLTVEDALKYLKNIIVFEEALQDSDFNLNKELSSSFESIFIRIHRMAIPFGNWKNQSFLSPEDCRVFLEDVLLKESLLKEAFLNNDV